MPQVSGPAKLVAHSWLIEETDDLWLRIAPRLPSCETCKFGLEQDTGSSNYTIEGVDFTCLQGLNPNGTFDKFYGYDERLDFALQCSAYCKGTPVQIDVEQEDRYVKPYDYNNLKPLAETYSNDPEVKRFLSYMDILSRLKSE